MSVENQTAERRHQASRIVPGGDTSRPTWTAVLGGALRKLAVAGLVLMAGLAEVRAAHAPLLAQTDAEAAEPSFILDGLILAVLIGGAVFAVCRAGRRN